MKNNNNDENVDTNGHNGQNKNNSDDEGNGEIEIPFYQNLTILVWYFKYKINNFRLLFNFYSIIITIINNY